MDNIFLGSLSLVLNHHHPRLGVSVGLPLVDGNSGGVFSQISALILNSMQLEITIGDVWKEQAGVEEAASWADFVVARGGSGAGHRATVYNDSFLIQSGELYTLLRTAKDSRD
ncbi:hypothetical protein AVEN_9671-1 [Araneus ventricosus]|uniref:Uncharacterized protein n=1 Tax=Araneus ventricosus TaxID=182803 RepID=A0A4Y2UKD2_ARAVE|nr:hypothetical protein AVEN_9671-1 [Araneus ventricosus]